ASCQTAPRLVPSCRGLELCRNNQLLIGSVLIDRHPLHLLPQHQQWDDPPASASFGAQRGPGRVKAGLHRILEPRGGAETSVKLPRLLGIRWHTNRSPVRGFGLEFISSRHRSEWTALQQTAVRESYGEYLVLAGLHERELSRPPSFRQSAVLPRFDGQGSLHLLQGYRLDRRRRLGWTYLERSEHPATQPRPGRLQHSADLSIGIRLRVTCGWGQVVGEWRRRRY